MRWYMLDCHGRPQIGVKKTQLPIKRPFVGIVSLVSIVFFFGGGLAFRLNTLRQPTSFGETDWCLEVFRAFGLGESTTLGA